MKGVKKITLQLVAYLSISVVTLLIFNQSVFVHSHTTNGETYTHAHPYDKPEQSHSSTRHTHNKTEIFFFQHLEILFPLLFISFAFIFKLREEGHFRDDFFYRLCSDVIKVPTLYERIQSDKEELTDLISFLIKRILGKESNELLEMVLDVIDKKLGSSYPWPGPRRP